MRNGRELNKVYPYIVLSLHFYKVSFKRELFGYIKTVEKDKQKIENCSSDGKN